MALFRSNLLNNISLQFFFYILFLLFSIALWYSTAYVSDINQSINQKIFIVA